jgi:hypothetical protein
MVTMHKTISNRCGGVYLAVLGTSLVVSLLALSALGLQRIQNRMLTASSDIRQAQLNAEAAINLGLLTTLQDEAWRDTYADTTGAWFSRGTGNGTSSLEVIDPSDDDLDDDAGEPFLLKGVGASGRAVQRVELLVEPQSQPADALYAAANAGGSISGRNDTDFWDAIVAAYTDPAVGTEISYSSLATTTPNLGRNVSFETTADYWTSAPTPTANIARATNVGGHDHCLRVNARTAKTAGPSQYIDDFIKPGANYVVRIQAYVGTGWGNVFTIKLVAKGTGNASAVTSTSSPLLVEDGAWTQLEVTIAAPLWSGDLEYARVTFDTDSTFGHTDAFYIDLLDIRESVTGRIIQRKLLGPGLNQLYTGAPTNSNGIYWIDCGGGKLTIDRSRILGTLLVLNPGTGSCIDHGPIHISPYSAGYPALVVNGNFTIRPSFRGLNEAESSEAGTNFNPTEMPYEFNNVLCNSTDTSPNDIYPSEILGLVAVSGNLTFENQPRVRGQIVVGGTITGTVDLEHRLDAVYSPPPGFTGSTTYERRHASERKVVLP